VAFTLGTLSCGTDREAGTARHCQADRQTEEEREARRARTLVKATHDLDKYGLFLPLCVLRRSQDAMCLAQHSIVRAVALGRSSFSCEPSTRRATKAFCLGCGAARAHANANPRVPRGCYRPIARAPCASNSARCRAADSRRNSLTTCAKDSGFTPLSACAAHSVTIGKGKGARAAAANTQAGRACSRGSRQGGREAGPGAGHEVQQPVSGASKQTGAGPEACDGRGGGTGGIPISSTSTASVGLSRPVLSRVEISNKAAADVHSRGVSHSRATPRP